MNRPAKSTAMWKIDSQNHGEWSRHVYENTFCRESVRGIERLVVAPSDHPFLIMRALVQKLRPPVLLLWVLHTPRAGNEPGRYQSPPLELAEATDLLDRFAAFFETDARSDIWAHSGNPPATVVFERHNLIYAYGDVSEFAGELARQGISEGEVRIPSPHAHNYHPELDRLERELADSLDWRIAALRPGDEQ